MLDVRHGSQEEALGVLGWMERDRDEFEQVISLAGLEAGHAERFERAMRSAVEARFGHAPGFPQGACSLDSSSALA